MNNDKAAGKAKQIAGRAQRTVGKLTGNKEMQVKGALREAGGKVQNTWGKAKDAAQDAVQKTRAKSTRAASTRDPVVTTRTTRTTTRRVKRG